MNRRAFLTGAGASLAAALAGCLGEASGEGCEDSLQTDEDDSMGRFLGEDETPENTGARKLLTTVEEVTDGVTRFTDANNTERIGFSEDGDTWEIRYRGTPHAGEDRFREEIAELSTTFASNRPDDVSLMARSLHECTTGTWHVCADTATAYERGQLDRKTFVDRVYGTAEVVNNC
ncbi:MAG: hypothetical protein V5A55_08230 [Halovenus sp.]